MVTLRVRHVVCEVARLVSLEHSTKTTEKQVWNRCFGRFFGIEWFVIFGRLFLIVKVLPTQLTYFPFRF